MTTATSIPTVGDALRERLATAGGHHPPSHQLREAILVAAEAMADYSTEELRKSEEEWLDARIVAAGDAVEQAAIGALVEQLVGIAEDVEDSKAPAGFLEASTDALRSDVELAQRVREELDR